MLTLNILVITSLVLFWLILALLFFEKRKRNNVKLNEDKILLKYNIKRKEIIKTNVFINKFINKHFWNKKSNWISIETFFLNFNNSQIKKQIKWLLEKSSKTNLEVSKSFIVNDLKWMLKNPFLFFISGKLSEDKRFINILIEWKPEKKQKKQNSKFSPVVLNKIIKKSYKENIFIGIKLFETENNENFINKILSKLIKLEDLNYVIERNILILIIGFDNEKQNKKRAEKIILALKEKQKNNILGLKHLIEGSAIFYFKSLNSYNKYLNAVSVLEYLINLSVETKIEFIDQFNNKYNLGDAFDSGQNSLIFRNNIANGKIKRKLITIQSSKSKKTDINWVQPFIEGIKEQDYEKYLSNNFYKTSLINANALMHYKNKEENKLIIDISDNWLIENFKAITNKNIIYLINLRYDKISHDLEKIIIKMLKSNFSLSLRITEINDKLLNFISETNMKYLVIDEKLASDPYNSNIYFQIFKINKMCLSKDIQLIFENPQNFEDINREIGIKKGLFFNHKY